LGKFIPPVSTGPYPIPPVDTGGVALIFTQEKRLIEIKYVEKGIVIEDVDRCSSWAAAQGLSSLTTKRPNRRNEVYL
jgi:hypothetical protein